MSRFSSRKCGRQRFTQSNLGCFLCPPEMTPSLRLSLLPFHPIVEKLHFRGLLAVSHPIPAARSRLPTPCCYGSRQMCIGEEDTPILRFPLFTYLWSCSVEARGAHNRSPVYCAMLNSVDRQTDEDDGNKRVVKQATVASRVRNATSRRTYADCK